MKIQLMKQSDFEEVYALLKEAGLSLAEKKKELYEYKMILQLNPICCFVAKEKNKIIGAVFGAFNGKRGWIYHLAVNPTYQKQGIGSLLLKKTEVFLKKVGATKIFLGIALSNLKVVPFYENNGWSIEQDAILLKKEFWIVNDSKRRIDRESS